MSWTVTIHRRAAKNLSRLPRSVREVLVALLYEIEKTGPVRGNWPNFSSLGQGRHHCHLKKGNPTYVAVWEVKDKSIRLVEITYVGTHAKAPY